VIGEAEDKKKTLLKLVRKLSGSQRTNMLSGVKETGPELLVLKKESGAAIGCPKKLHGAQPEEVETSLEGTRAATSKLDQKVIKKNILRRRAVGGVLKIKMKRDS